MKLQQVQKTILCFALTAGLGTGVASAQYVLDVDVDPPGAGVVGSYPSVAEVSDGDWVTLTATAADGWEFAGWDGDIVAAESTMTFELIDDTSLTAVFVESTAGEYTLTAYVDPSGAGTVVRDPVQEGYDAGEQVTLSAFANPGFAFTGWAGDVPEGADASSDVLVLTIAGDTDVYATFAAASTLDHHEDGTDAPQGAACGAMGVVGLGALFGLMLSMKLGRSRR